MALVRISARDRDVRSVSSELEDDLFKLYLWGEGSHLVDSLYIEITEPVKRAFRDAVLRWDRDDEARDRDPQDCAICGHPNSEHEPTDESPNGTCLVRTSTQLGFCECEGFVWRSDAAECMGSFD